MAETCENCNKWDLIGGVFGYCKDKQIGTIKHESLCFDDEPIDVEPLYDSKRNDDHCGQWEPRKGE